MSTFASVHIDGAVLCSSVLAGVLPTPGVPSPVSKFELSAGVQIHPIWTLDRLAVVVYCYTQTAIEMDAKTLQVNVHGTLVSNETSIVIADAVEWHTSRAVRDAAENMITRLTAGTETHGGLTRLPNSWPTQQIVLPISRQEFRGQTPTRRRRSSGEERRRFPR